MEISNDKNHSARLLAVYTLGFVIIAVVILSWVEEAKITPKVSHLIRGLNFFFFLTTCLSTSSLHRSISSQQMGLPCESHRRNKGCAETFAT